MLVRHRKPGRERGTELDLLVSPMSDGVAGFILGRNDLTLARRSVGVGSVGGAVARKSRGKISPTLAHQLKHAGPNEPIEVIVQLQPARRPAGGSRAERVTALKKGFNDNFERFTQRIDDNGGEILGTAWINSTVRARMTPSQIRSLGTDQLITEIDSPRPITFDVS